jgi:hypothetical protein
MADNLIQTIERPDATSVDWSSGPAYIDGDHVAARSQNPSHRLGLSPLRRHLLRSNF